MEKEVIKIGKEAGLKVGFKKILKKNVIVALGVGITTAILIGLSNLDKDEETVDIFNLEDSNEKNSKL